MIHVKKLVDTIGSAERSNAKQVIINLSDAKKISYDLSQLMADYISLQKENQNLKNQNQQTNIEMDGGEW